MMTSIRESDISVASSLTVSRLMRWVIVQNSSRIVPALSMADITLTATAAEEMSPPKRVMKKRPASMKIGLPGGWPTSSLNAWRINSGQSQKLAVGSIVSR